LIHGKRKPAANIQRRSVVIQAQSPDCHVRNYKITRVNPSTFLSHGLSWLLPSAGLTAFLLLVWALRGRRALKWGYAGTGLLLLACGFLTQALTLWILRWPDGSMGSYGLLIGVLAALGAVWARKPPT
jgi:hypothetical protein